MALVAPAASTSPSSLMGVVSFRALSSVQVSWSRYHAVPLSFTLLSWPAIYLCISLLILYIFLSIHLFVYLYIYLFFVCLFVSPWIIQTILHIHTLSLSLLHLMSLYLSRSLPPLYQWCNGPHCGPVVVLHTVENFVLHSSEGCLIFSISVSGVWANSCLGLVFSNTTA